MQQKENRLIALLRRTRLGTRLLTVCLLLSLIPMAIVGMYAYHIYTGSITANLGQSTEQAVRLLGSTVTSELDKFSAYLNTISVSDAVQGILVRPDAERILPDGSVALTIKQRVQEIPAQSRYLKNIRVVDRLGNVLYDLGFDDIPRAEFESVLKSLDASSPEDSLQYVKTYRGVNTLVLGRKIYQFARPDVHIGYILVYIHETLLSEKVFPGIDFGPGSNILLMDGGGRVLSSRDPALLGTSLELLTEIEQARSEGRATLNMRLNDARQLVVFDYNSALHTYFIATIPETYITAETSRITGNLIIVAVIVGALALALALILYRSITRPIGHVVAFCEAASNDKIDDHISDSSPDELGYLGRAVDRFVHQIQQLLDKSKKDNHRRRELELEMLQYQINPHFLFNTLNSLQWVAMLNEVPVLEDGIASLSQLLQRTILRTEERVPLAEEIENLAHYVAIQKIRYADCFQVRYDVDEQLSDVCVPRFILQPLVENAILHGTREGGEAVEITIACALGEDGNVQLSVEDDGQGFVFDAQRQAREGFSGIGLKNVSERIALTYGPPYGLTITSEPGRGTRCLISLPADPTNRKEPEDNAAHIAG